MLSLFQLSTKFSGGAQLVFVDLLLVCKGAFGIVEASGDPTEFFHSQVEDSLVFCWRDLAFFELVGSLGSDLEFRNIHNLVKFFISFVTFLVRDLSPDISLQVSNLGGFPCITEELDCL